MRKLLGLAVLILPFQVMAQAEYCTLQSENPELIAYVKEMPQYFAKGLTQGTHVFYIGDGSNHVLKLRDGNEETRDKRIPGYIDPVPSPDGLLLTEPGIQFFKVDEVMNKGTEAEPFFRDDTLGGVYQSVALLKIDQANTNIRTYRVVADDNDSQVRFRDYKIDWSVNPPRVDAIAPTVKHCPGKHLKTVMVSKTGKYVTGFDPKTNSTKIFDMVDISSANRCRELHDLGYGTGKIEWNIGEANVPEQFNFADSDKQIAFHLDYFGADIGEYFSGVETTIVKDIVTLDVFEPSNRGQNWKLRVGNLRKMFSESRLGSGGYYPSYMRGGKLIYIFDDSDSFSFRVMDPNRAKPYDFMLPAKAATFTEAWANVDFMPSNWKERLHRVAAVGSLYAHECLRANMAQDDITAVGATSFFLGMSRETCTALVQAKWEEQKATVVNNPRWERDPRFSIDTIKNYTVADLLQTCGAMKGHDPYPEPEKYGTPTATHLEQSQLYHHYCMGCHVPGGRLTGIMHDGYANTVDFTRDEFDRSNLALAHNLSSQRRVKLGMEADRNRWARLAGTMPPQNGLEPPANTDYDHGAALLELLKNDEREVSELPSRIPLYVREDERPNRIGRASPESVPGANTNSGVRFMRGRQPINEVSMPQTSTMRVAFESVELVNNTNQLMQEIGANRFSSTAGFLFPGRGLFPGEDGTCGSTLAAGSSCTIQVAFAPPAAQHYRTTLQVNYLLGGTQQSAVLALDGVGVGGVVR